MMTATRVSRAERTAEAARLLRLGLSGREATRVMGVSYSYLREVIADPAGELARRRKLRYGGVCRRCGARTDGSNGRALAPKVCAACAAEEAHEDAYWTAERLMAAAREWARRYGHAPTAAEWRRAQVRDGYRYPNVAMCYRSGNRRRDVPWTAWGEFLDAAGFPGRRLRSWTAEAIIAALRAWAAGHEEPEELEWRLRLTPFSRSEFALCVRTWRDQRDEVERARRWYVRVEQAFAGTPLTTGWGGEILGRRNGSRARTSLRRLDRLAAIANRLRGVQIEELDWRAVLDRYDHEDAVFYLDPPYIRATRRRPRIRGGKDYAHELSDADHAELVDRVLHLRASVLVSGYDHELYRPLEIAGFERIEFDVLCSSARTRTDASLLPRTEVVWRKVNRDGRLW